MAAKYTSLKLKIIRLLVRRRLVSAKKLVNAALCYTSHWLKRGKSAPSPFVINFELSNECNANCVFCRTDSGEIYDCNPLGGQFVPKGEMPFELYTGVIDEVADRLLMAILYVNGEPLVYKRIFDAIRYASERRVAAMISTNGILLTRSNAEKLLDAGIAFVKVAVSGFSPDTFGRQARRGNIEKILANVAGFQEENVKRGNLAILLLDFILYDYNRHELETAREFCLTHGIMFNVRPGNTRNIEVEVDYQKSALPFAPGLCDWPWKMLTINWDGDVFPCCDYVVWSGQEAYKRIGVGDIGIKKLWNDDAIRRLRRLHADCGRSAIPICRDCRRSGISFKY